MVFIKEKIESLQTLEYNTLNPQGHYPDNTEKVIYTFYYFKSTAEC